MSTVGVPPDVRGIFLVGAIGVVVALACCVLAAVDAIRHALGRDDEDAGRAEIARLDALWNSPAHEHDERDTADGGTP